MVKGVKAFGAGFQCRGFQFKENEVFEVTGLPKACRRGFHFCENPLDTLDYYPLIDDAGNVTEFAEVEALGDVDTEENKVSTNKIRIGAKLGLAGFVKASFDFLWEKCWTDPNATTNTSGDSEGNHAQLASSGNHAQLASSGYGAQLASSGNHAQLASSGDGATYKPVCVKSALIDGETIKADTWYALRDGEFVEVQL